MDNFFTTYKHRWQTSASCRFYLYQDETLKHLQKYDKVKYLNIFWNGLVG